MALNKCVTQPDFNGQAANRPEVPDNPTEAILRARQRAEDILTVADNASDEVFQNLVQRTAYVGELGRSVVLNPKAARNRSVLMARLLQWINDPADPTVIRSFMREARARGQNAISALPLIADDMAMNASRLNLAETVVELRDGIYDLLRQGGIRSKKQMNEIFVRALEEGTSKYVPQAGTGVNGRFVMERLRASTRDWMTRQGLSDEIIDNVIFLTEGYIAADEVAYQAARAAGLDIPRETGIGFFNRQFTPEATRQLRRRRVDFMHDAWNKSQTDPVQSTMASRRTFDFVIEDEARFADAMDWETPTGQRMNTLRSHVDAQEAKVAEYTTNLNTPDPNRQVFVDAQQNRVNTYQQGVDAALPGYNQRTLDQMQQKLDRLRGEVNKPKPGYNQHGLDQATEKLERLTAEYQAELDQVLPQMAAMLDDEQRLVRSLVDMDFDKLNRLADNGTLSKIPMSSHRVFEVLKGRYEMPFNGLGEMMMTDPLEAHRAYTAALERGMRDSSLTQSTVRGALENGWAVSEVAYKANQDLYSEYVNLLDAVHGSEMFDAGRIIQDPSQLRSLYVHPDVARSYTAMLDFSTSSHTINAMTKMITNLPLIGNILRINKKVMLTTVGFVSKNLYGVMVNGWQSGSNIITYPRDVLRLAAVQAGGRNALGALDDVARRYTTSGLTEQGLYLEAVRRGVLNGMNFMGVGRAAGESFSNLTDLPAMANYLRYLGTAAKRGEVGGVLNRALEGAESFAGDLLAPLLSITSLLEDSMKFNLLKTVTATDGLDAMARIPSQLMGGAGFQKFDSLDEAVQHVHRHFVDFNDTTATDKLLSSTVFPFWTYVSRNLPLQVRYMMRHPGRFMAYYRLYNLANGEAQRRGDDFPEAGMNSWQADGMPVYVQTDPDDPNSYISFATEYFDPILEVMGVLGKEFTSNTSQERVLSQAGEESVWSRMGDYLLQQTYPTLQNIVESRTGRSTFTGQEFREEDSLLGGIIPVAQIAERTGLSQGFVRRLAESNIPFVQRLNSMNPFGVFGVSSRSDAMGRIIREERRSIFGVSRFDSDPLIAGREQEIPLLLRTARTLGFTATAVDVTQNVQNAQSFYSSQQTAFQTQANRLAKKAELAESTAEYDAAMHEYLIYAAMADEMAQWDARIGLWLEQRGQVTATERRDVNQFIRESRARRSRGEDPYATE